MIDFIMNNYWVNSWVETEEEFVVMIKKSSSYVGRKNFDIQDNRGENKCRMKCKLSKNRGINPNSKDAQATSGRWWLKIYKKWKI